MKECNKCKIIKSDENFSKKKKNTDGLQHYCKPCYVENLREWRDKNPHKEREYAAVYKNKHPERLKATNYKNMIRPQSRFCQLKWAAKRRNMIVEITFEQYVKLIELGECYYCSGPLPLQGGGLDRVDNTKGYLIDNVVPCCSRCNELFMDYDKQETFDHLEKILKLKKQRNTEHMISFRIET